MDSKESKADESFVRKDQKSDEEMAKELGCTPIKIEDDDNDSFENRSGRWKVHNPEDGPVDTSKYDKIDIQLTSSSMYVGNDDSNVFNLVPQKQPALDTGKISWPEKWIKDNKGNMRITSKNGKVTITGNMYDVNVVKFDKVHKVMVYNGQEGSIVQITKNDPKTVPKEKENENVITKKIVLDDRDKEVVALCKNKNSKLNSEKLHDSIHEYVQSFQ